MASTRYNSDQFMTIPPKYLPLKSPRELPALLLVIIAIIGMAIFVPAFRNESNLTVVGETAAYLGVLACGEALTLLGGGLDLSVGSILALSSCSAAAAMAAGWAWPIAALLAVAAGTLAGAFNGFLIAKRGFPPILATLATLLIFRHGSGILTGDRNYGPFPNSFSLMGSGWNPVWIVLLVTLILTIGLQKFKAGRRLLALGGNEAAANLSGVKITRLRIGTYMLSGACAGIAGLIVMAFNNTTQASVGQGAELEAIAACVVGGIRLTGGDGALPGAALGALLLALLHDSFVLTGRPVSQYGIITGAVILIAAILEQIRIKRAAQKEI